MTAPQAKAPTYQPYIKRIEMIGLAPIDLPRGALVFVVGPNNGGKSTFLNEIQAKVGFASGTKWIERLEWELGAEDDYRAFLSRYFTETDDTRFLKDRAGNNFDRGSLYGFYSNQQMHGTAYLVKSLNAEGRIHLANRAQAPDTINKTQLHPYHKFYYSGDAELEFSKKIKAAFGKDLRVNRQGAAIIGHLGKAPGGERLSVEYDVAVLNQMQPPPAADALVEIERIIASIDEKNDDESSRLTAVRQIKKSAESLGKSWTLKTMGIRAVPKGELHTKVLEFIRSMRSHGVVILEEGEIENYVPSVGGHGQAWVRAALESGALPSDQMSSIERQFGAIA